MSDAFTPSELRKEADLYKGICPSTYSMLRYAADVLEDCQRTRKLLAIAYAGANLYADDGELQDNRHPAIDFKRDSLDDIEAKMDQRAHAALSARQDGGEG
jgi:hypothetical protein